MRRLIIEQSKRAGVGHIGSALSIADLVEVLYMRIAKIESPEQEDRDRIILSKGHAALAQYVALHLKGWLSEQALNTYAGNDSQLCVHPEAHLRGVDFSTGSLGQGVTYAVGAALAAKIQGSARKVYCILSDAELNEGSFWEAAQFAAHHQLSQLVFLLDNNGQQALGFTKDVLNLGDVEAKMGAFGWQCQTINGHDKSAIEACLSALDNATKKPHFIIANTVCGQGVSYMEGTIEWHYKSMNDAQYETAMDELGGDDA